MKALELTAAWPAATVSVAAGAADGDGHFRWATTGDIDRVYKLASVAKPISTWAILVAVEEGLVALDDPIGQPGCTLRHLLAHAGGYPFDGAVPVAPPARGRIYSNSGIDLAADAVARAASMPFAEYLREAVLAPLRMSSTSLKGSAAKHLRGSLADLMRFCHEVVTPQLIAPETAALTRTVQFPALAGVVPGVGRFDPCPWGLGFEIRGDKTPHWTGSRNSPHTFGHFGGAGTFLWVDPGVTPTATRACIALTDLPFDDWSPSALTCWPQLSDAVIAELTSSEAPA